MSWPGGAWLGSAALGAVIHREGSFGTSPRAELRKFSTTASAVPISKTHLRKLRPSGRRASCRATEIGALSATSTFKGEAPWALAGASATLVKTRRSKAPGVTNASGNFGGRRVRTAGAAH